MCDHGRGREVCCTTPPNLLLRNLRPERWGYGARHSIAQLSGAKSTECAVRCAGPCCPVPRPSSHFESCAAHVQCSNNGSIPAITILASRVLRPVGSCLADVWHRAGAPG